MSLCIAFDSLSAETLVKQESVKLLRTNTAGALWQLQVRNASLVESFHEIERISGLRIHFSILPEGPVTATCVADQLSQVLRCLLGDSVNLVFARSDKSKNGYDEIWVLGSSFVASDKVSGCDTSSQNQSIAGEEQGRAMSTLVEAMRDADPQRRADAVFDLATQSDGDSTEIDAILLKSLRDTSAMVRGQALTGWAQRQGDSALPELQQAMRDADASVRLQAVELTNDFGLLSEALHDPDILIRQLAESKLSELSP